MSGAIYGIDLDNRPQLRRLIDAYSRNQVRSSTPVWTDMADAIREAGEPIPAERATSDLEARVHALRAHYQSCELDALSGASDASGITLTQAISDLDEVLGIITEPTGYGARVRLRGGGRALLVYPGRWSANGAMCLASWSELDVVEILDAGEPDA